MKKEAFLRALNKRLEGMTAEEKARALEFCAESIDDRVEDGMDEEDAVAALGNVEDVARGLLADQPLGAVVRERVRRESAAGHVILLICASPLLVTFFAVGLSVYAALWAAMVSIYAAVASLLIAGAGCALAVLARGDSYGYQMVKDVGSHVEVSESTLYPILRRLEAGGYLRVYSREHSGRLRKYYGITEEGRAHLDELRGEWRQVLDVYAFIMEGTEGER